MASTSYWYAAFIGLHTCFIFLVLRRFFIINLIKEWAIKIGIFCAYARQKSKA